VRHDADFARGQLRVDFDAVDERRSPCGCGKRLLEGDDIRPLARDHLERAKRFLSGEGLRAAEILAFHERLQML
jgi:hypothetical protein